MGGPLWNMDASGYHGSFLALLNPYGLLTGALFVLLFMVHGALYLTIKTTGALSLSSQAMATHVYIHSFMTLYHRPFQS